MISGQVLKKMPISPVQLLNNIYSKDLGKKSKRQGMNLEMCRKQDLVRKTYQDTKALIAEDFNFLGWVYLQFDL